MKFKTVLLFTCLIISIFLGSCTSSNKKEIVEKIPFTSTETFLSSDKVEITADLYMAHDTKTPFILLFHQAYFSRGEYDEIAPKLNALGFNCMAIDQRSGYSFGDKINKTKESATKLGKSTGYYTDAEPDLISAFKYAKKNCADGPILIWGSSYSASLVLYLSGTGSIKPDGILAFSPSECLNKYKVINNVEKIEQPVFITSGRTEKPQWIEIFNEIPSDKKMFFLPKESEGDGSHGSSTLLEEEEINDLYWNAVIDFLKQFEAE